MKLGKTALIFLVVGIFVIGVAILGMTYSQQSEEQSRLNQELSMAQLRLKKYVSNEQLSSQQEELESQLSRRESQLRTVKASLYQSIQSIEITETLYEVAEACNVEIVEINSPGMSSEKVEEVNLSALTLNVKVEGDVLNLVDFIHAVTKEYPTGVVESVEIDVPQPTEEEGETAEELGEEEERTSADIKLIIYTYEGD